MALCVHTPASRPFRSQPRPRSPARRPRQIIDPWGEVVGRLTDPHATGIAVADIDLGALRRVREKMPISNHRTRGRALWMGAAAAPGAAAQAPA